MCTIAIIEFWKKDIILPHPVKPKLKFLRNHLGDDLKQLVTMKF